MSSQVKSRSPGRLEPLDPAVSQLHLSHLPAAGAGVGAGTVVQSDLPLPKSPRPPTESQSSGGGLTKPSVMQLQPLSAPVPRSSKDLSRMHPNSLMQASGTTTSVTTPPSIGGSSGSLEGFRMPQPTRSSVVAHASDSASSLPPAVSSTGKEEKRRHTKGETHEKEKDKDAFGTETTSLGGGIVLVTSFDESSSLPPIRSTSRSPERPSLR
jgi:hypothetical protein